jgi:hypothetical protein
VGLNFCVVNGEGDDIVINPNIADTIRTLTNAAGDSLTNSTIDNSICLVALTATSWFYVGSAPVGTWADGDTAGD